MPFADIEGVSVFGMAQLSTRFVRECISSNVPVCYYSDDGHYFGMTSSSLHVNPVRQKRQVHLTDDEEFCLQWARTVVDAKIRNSLALLESFDAAYSLTEEDTEGLRHSLANLQYAETVNMANASRATPPNATFVVCPRLSNQRISNSVRAAHAHRRIRLTRCFRLATASCTATLLVPLSGMACIPTLPSCIGQGLAMPHSHQILSRS